MGGGDRSYRPDLHEVCMMGLVHGVFWAYIHSVVDNHDNLIVRNYYMEVVSKKLFEQSFEKILNACQMSNIRDTRACSVAL